MKTMTVFSADRRYSLRSMRITILSRRHSGTIPAEVVPALTWEIKP